MNTCTMLNIGTDLAERYLKGSCTDEHCALCATPLDLRKPGQTHAGISPYQVNDAASDPQPNASDSLDKLVIKLTWDNEVQDSIEVQGTPPMLRRLKGLIERHERAFIAYDPSNASTDPGIQKLLSDALSLSKYAAAPFASSAVLSIGGAIQPTTEEWWDGLKTQIEEIQPRLTEVCQNLAISGTKASFTKEVPVVAGWYWHWNGDEEAEPVPLSLLWSGFLHACFVSRGQLGLEEGVSCAEYGGWWLPMALPDTNGLVPKGN